METDAALPCGLFRKTMQPGIPVHTCNNSTREVRGGGWAAWGQPGLQSHDKNSKRKEEEEEEEGRGEKKNDPIVSLRRSTGSQNSVRI